MTLDYAACRAHFDWGTSTPSATVTRGAPGACCIGRAGLASGEHAAQGASLCGDAAMSGPGIGARPYLRIVYGCSWALSMRSRAVGACGRSDGFQIALRMIPRPSRRAGQPTSSRTSRSSCHPEFNLSEREILSASRGTVPQPFHLLGSRRAGACFTAQENEIGNDRVVL